ncbi:xanthine dehydrogenase family protein subunit M [bacterium]|nr:xanthine dehydrogenase family protein subunit M [bacterium]
MQNFNFIRPNNLDEACDLLVRYKDKAKIIAGGTDLIIALKEEKLSNCLEIIMDISNLKELNYIKEEGKYIRIGPGARHAEIAKNKLINKYAPVLSMASSVVGSPQIRNKGTIAGNIVTASPAADIIPALIVLDSILVIRKGKEKRKMFLKDVFEGPNKVNLKSDEIVSEIFFEKLPLDAKYDFIKLARRNAVDKSRMNIAVITQQNKNKEITDVRISVGSLTPIPGRFKDAEDLLLGEIPTQDLIQKAGKKIAEEMVNKSGYRWSTEYKEPVVKSLIGRVLNRVLEVE